MRFMFVYSGAGGGVTIVNKEQVVDNDSMTLDDVRTLAAALKTIVRKSPTTHDYNKAKRLA